MFAMGIWLTTARHGANAAADAVAPHVRPPRPYSDDDEPWVRADNIQGDVRANEQDQKYMTPSA
jgi:hypothetical protein